MPDDSLGWGEPDPPPTSRRPKAPPEVVRDDWEDDDDEEEPQEEKNKKIWHKANHEAAAPMPTFIVSSSNVAPPPVAAFQPAFKILKRPVNSSETSSFPQSYTSKESLEDREARYQVARNRIFGATSGSDTNTVHGVAQKDNAAIRDPRGPNEIQNPLTDTAAAKGRPETPNTNQVLQ
ncbi:hypothetical protein DFJ43DRAFT_1227180 [Lentinula guzmanii]|uniref:SUZ domain-containing protein n=2 Tax=Lentinula TaxID=5352 RepID=A0AA38JC86_9AGAR|nr:hypothetical protein DFJ43DRAFT_1227180 [Lentinula guzmanii]KAJ3746549.1 hypothetical protein DFH05DRAFT_1485621 [Lentinula detonsa]KAJ3980542.1 hypothetical protein F5890DRAFT_1568673 [Lentinula detonsa]